MNDIKNTELKKLQNKDKAKIQQKFFKTGKGEYAEGDIFLGVIVPEVRKLAKKNLTLQFSDIFTLLSSKYHEVRLLGVIILVYQYEKYSKEMNFVAQKTIVDFYLKNINFINNWDLVDVSCYKILGHYCFQTKSQTILKDLSYSKSLWERRISIVSCFAFIKQAESEFLYSLIPKFLNDKEDLIHKACGWMLREAGKQNKEKLIEFLKNTHKFMPRIMFRYAIEKLSPQEKKAILNG
jgi:3-methyladenine DNA glycosylase AlkD